jgi:hypothetical protein
MESWRKAFVEGFAPGMSDEELAALSAGLQDNDPTLIQGNTTQPPPLSAMSDWPVEGADAVGYALWKGRGLRTVGEVDAAFAVACRRADDLLNEPHGSRYFLNWWDTAARFEAFAKVLVVVELILAERRGVSPDVIAAAVA